jgi:hypothetical protein
MFSGAIEIAAIPPPTPRPTPVTRSPSTSRPTTQKPVTLTPTTSRPTTRTPVVVPTTLSPSSAPSSSRFPVVLLYEVGFRNGNTMSGIEDLVPSLNLLAPQVAAETFPTVRDRRRLAVTMELPTRVTDVLNTSKFSPSTWNHNLLLSYQWISCRRVVLNTFCTISLSGDCPDFRHLSHRVTWHYFDHS